jgi:glucan 1,3-beta-glucosidase
MTHSFSNKFNKKLRGVNLGGWLVLEKWITPSLFEGLDATDETSYCVELGDRADFTLKQHWNSFITRDDFVWLASVGINAVRLPIGHWLFGANYPYHRSYGDNRYPFVENGLEIVDKVFDWAEEFGLHVLLDLHAAPGCQNGFDNGGIKDVCEWHTSPAYVEHSLNVLEQLAQRYGNRPALHGIETLNEPRWDIETDFLKKYHTDAYHRIRKHCSPDDVAVVFHDGIRSYREYIGLLREPEFQNVVFDIHRYQCFVWEEINMDIYQHIHHTVCTWKDEADDIIRDLGEQTYCGEWSLGLSLKAVSLWAEGPSNCALDKMDDYQLNLAYRAYAAAQLLTFEKYAGWFFWNYKTETTPQWSFRDCIAKGWFPGDFS